MLMDRMNAEGIGSFRSFLSETVAEQSSVDGKGIKEATVGLKADNTNCRWRFSVMKSVTL